MLATPLVIDGRVLAKKGDTAILGLSDIDNDGHLNGKASLTIHLMRLQLADRVHKIDSTIQVSAPSSGDRVYVPAATILAYCKSPSPSTLPNSH